MTVVVVATIYPRPEYRDEVVATFTAAIARVHAEDDGCHLYALHESADRLVMVEKWESQEALDAHSRGPALKELGGQLAGKLSSDVDVQTLRPRPAGTAEQGTL
jgi:quinol monooxygenase YgiN